jgi:phosphoglycerate dehydrogenase-like enzyme
VPLPFLFVTALVLTLLIPPALSEAEAAVVLARLGDAVELQFMGYVEPTELRSRRRAGRVAPEDEHLVPAIAEASRATLARSHALLALDVPPAVTELCPELRFIQMVTAGTDHVDVAGLAARGVAVASAAGVAAPPIAEFVLARLLQVWKHLRQIDQQQGQRDWSLRYGELVAGKSMAIVGLGAIGRETARRARAFGMRVVASRASARAGDTDPEVDELFPAADLHRVVADVDAVVVCMPATAGTDAMFDAAAFAAMAPGTVFVNVARGSLVDEVALVEALASGHLRAAVLDVTVEEPLPATSALWKAPNLYLSPHSSTSLDGFMERCLALTADNLSRLLEGRELRNLVSP